MSRTRLANLEQQIERLVESGFARLFTGPLHPRELIARLARAIEAGARHEADGSVTAPDQYRVRLHPDDCATIQAEHPTLGVLLAEAVIALAAQAGMRLRAGPNIALQPDETLLPLSIGIDAIHATGSLSSTQMMVPSAPPRQASSGLYNPQLIIQGTRVFPLDRPVINIGRRKDNHLVIDNPHISRQHAQLRLRFGRYVIYDLGSSAGVFVNEHRVTEALLRPGDVVALAGVLMIYVEDEPGAGGEGEAFSGDTQDQPLSGEAADADPTR
jgi:hypothetical protein